MAALRMLGGLLVVARAGAGEGHSEAAKHEATGELRSARNGAANGNGNANGNGRRDVWGELRVELARARRYGRPFALVRLRGAVGRNVRPHLRAIDREWAVNGTTFVLLPESTREGAERFVARLVRDAAELLDGCSVSVAAFPDDGVTSGALLKGLEPVRDVAETVESGHGVIGVPGSHPVHA